MPHSLKILAARARYRASVILGIENILHCLATVRPDELDETHAKAHFDSLRKTALQLLEALRHLPQTELEWREQEEERLRLFMQQ